MNKKSLVPVLSALVAVAAACPAEDEPLVPKFSSLYSAHFFRCADCHSPTGSGNDLPGIEQSLNFTTVATAYNALTDGMATGLEGNFLGCNGVPFIEPGFPARSLVVAVLDQPTRQAFDLGATADPPPPCDQDSISDMTLAERAGEPPDGFVVALKQWITDGAMND